MASLGDFTILKKKDTSSLSRSLLGNFSILQNRKDRGAEEKKIEPVRQVSLPSHLGGGEYLTSMPGALIKSPRSQEALGEAKTGQERDHIMSVALGGTSDRKNLQYLTSPEGTKWGDENRQEGKLSVEEEAIKDYKAGKISLPEARLKLATKQQEIQGLIPKQGVLANLPGAKTAKKVSWFFKNAFSNIKETFKDTTSEADLSPEERKAQREKIRPLFKEEKGDAMRFEVGEGLKQEPIVSGQIPTTRREKDIQRGENIAQTETPAGVFDDKTGKLATEILPSSSERGRALQMVEIRIDKARKDVERGLGLNAGKEFFKGVGRGVYSMPGSFANALDWYAQNLQNDKGYRKEIQKKFGVLGAEKKTGEVLGNISKKISNWSERIVNDTEVFRMHSAVYSNNRIIDDNTSKLAVLVGENIPTMALAVGLTAATGNPLSGASALGLLSGGQSFKEAREAGASIERANATGALVGIGESLLEILPLNVITKGDFGSKALKIGMSGLSESGEEGIQTVWSNLVEKWGYDKTRQWYQGVGESMLVGGITGGALGSVFTGTNQKAQRNAEVEAISKGIITQEQIDLLKRQIASQMIEKSSEIDVLLQEKILSTQDFGVQRPKISDFKHLLAQRKATQAPKQPQIEAIGTKTVKDTTDPKNFATAEEFVKAQTNYFYGGGSEIKKIDGRKISRGGELGDGFYFTGNKDKTKLYGGTTTDLKVELKNPLTITKDELWKKGGLMDKYNKNPKYNQELIKQGYDGVLVKEGNKIDQGIVFKPSQIKTKSQLIDIFNKAQEKPVVKKVKQEKETTYEPIKEPKEKFEGKVIDTTDYKDETLSRHYERVKEKYGFTDSVEYDKKTEKTEKKKAFDFIQRNPEKALRAGYGYENIPTGINPQVFRASLVASLMAQGKKAVADDVAKIQSSKMTEAAQTLAFGRLDIGEDVRITRNITNERLRKIGEKLGEKAPEKQIERAKREVKRQANEKANEVAETSKNTPLKDIDNLIDSILC